MIYRHKTLISLHGPVETIRRCKETLRNTKLTITNSAYNELFLLRKSAEGAWHIARYCTSKIRLCR